MSPSCPYAHFDGAYVLGALSPGERAEYRRHLAGCQACAAAVAELAPMPGLLGRADPAALRTDQPAAAPLPRLLKIVAGERRRQARRRRWRLAATALAASLVAAVGTVVGLELVAGPGAGGPAPAVEQMRPVAATVPVTATVSLTASAAGTGVELWCAYPPVDDLPGYDPSPRVFRLVAVGADGTSEQLGSWLAGPGDELTLTGVTRYARAELAWLELRGADDAELLRYTPG